MAEKFEALKAEPNAGTRGAGLELFLAELFGREHYRVDKDFVAAGRQVDLFVMRGGLKVLIEAKWTKRSCGQEVIDSLRARLDDAPSGVVGLVVSMAGFTAPVAERLERSPDLPILLMDGREVEAVVQQGAGLHALVQSKLDQLFRHRKVVYGRPLSGAPIWLQDLPESSLGIIDANGQEHPFWESPSEFCEALTSPELRNSDAVYGGVRLDLRLGVDDAAGLVELLKTLTQLGWVSSEGAWRIEQDRVAWSGLGPAELARQLVDWQPRYRGKRLHHTEGAMYVDESDDGMLTIVADISASTERFVRRCELTFILPGIPLDVSPYEAITAELPVMNTPVFEVLSDPPIHAGRLRSRGKPKSVQPLAYLVRQGSPFGIDGEPETWVEGIVVSDPMPRSSPAARINAGLPGPKLGHLFARLRQHHQPDDDVVHMLQWATSVEVAHVQVVHVTGDWDWGQDARPGSAESTLL